jgi:hypothetical protein
MRSGGGRFRLSQGESEVKQVGLPLAAGRPATQAPQDGFLVNVCNPMHCSRWTAGRYCTHGGGVGRLESVRGDHTLRASAAAGERRRCHRPLAARRSYSLLASCTELHFAVWEAGGSSDRRSEVLLGVLWGS